MSSRHLLPAYTYTETIEVETPAFSHNADMNGGHGSTITLIHFAQSQLDLNCMIDRFFKYLGNNFITPTA